jgi:hypothetical protein
VEDRRGREVRQGRRGERREWKKDGGQLDVDLFGRSGAGVL